MNVKSFELKALTLRTIFSRMSLLDSIEKQAFLVKSSTMTQPKLQMSTLSE